MKSLTLALILAVLSINAADACRCQLLREFAQTLEQNDQIFMGTILNKVVLSDSVKFQINVLKKWKGKLTPQSTTIISTTTGSCGVEFIVGETYIIYAKKNKTNICRRNKKASETFDGRLLDHYYFGKAIVKTFDDSDQRVLRKKLQLEEPQNLSEVKIVVVYDYRVLSPMETYKLNPMNFNAKNHTLIELDSEAKEALGTCVDKIIVMGSYLPKKGWNENKVLKAVKKKNVCKSK